MTGGGNCSLGGSQQVSPPYRLSLDGGNLKLVDGGVSVEPFWVPTSVAGGWGLFPWGSVKKAAAIRPFPIPSISSILVFDEGISCLEGSSIPVPLPHSPRRRRRRRWGAPT